MVEGFRATIDFINSRETKCYSAEEFIQTLREVKEDELRSLSLSFTCDWQRIKSENPVLVSEWRKLMENEKFKALSKLIGLRVRDCSVELKEELKRSMRRGNRFQYLRLEYRRRHRMKKGEGVAEAPAQDLIELTQYNLAGVDKLEIKDESSSDYSLTIENGTFVANVPEPVLVLKILSNRNLFLNTQIEELRVNIDRQDRQALETFMESMNKNHSLLQVRATMGKRRLKLPEGLTRQLNENFTKKLAMWIANGTKVQYGRMKLMVIGRGQAGKSSTVRSLLDLPIDENIESTVVAEANKDISISVKDFSIPWENTSAKGNWLSEELEEYMRKLQKDREEILVDKPKVELLPERESFKEDLIQQKVSNKAEPHTPKKPKNNNFRFVDIKSKLRAFRNNKRTCGKENLRIIPKVDEREVEPVVKSTFKEDPILRDISETFGESKIRSEGSSRDIRYNTRLALWDFGGQEVFSSLHHIFLTTGGLYVVVFDLQLMASQMDSELREIQFWLESIELHAQGSSVIMVGTRFWSVSINDITKIDTNLTSLVETKNIEVLASKRYCFFPIDNVDRRCFNNFLHPLKSKILHCLERESAEDDLKTNVWQKKISLSWIYFMNHLIKRFKGVISSNQLFQIANELGLNKERDVIPMLDFYKSAGGIIPLLKDNNVDSWKFSYVVLSPEWLLRIIGNFIYDEGMHPVNKRFYENGETRSLITNYEKSGVLSKRLLLLILKQAKVSATDTDFIINMSKEMLLLCEFDCNPEWSTVEGDSFYMVPAMNRQVADQVEIMKQASTDDCINFYVHCHKYIPIGVFERIICIMLSLNQNFGGATVEPMIKKNFACFIFREIEIYIENQKENRDFRIAVSKDEAEEMNVLLNVVNLIEEALETLRSDVLGSKMKLQIQIESVTEDKMRCSWTDLKASVKNPDSSKVRAILSDGRKKLKNYALFAPFNQVAASILQRKKEALRLKQEEEKRELEKNKLKWEYDVFLAHTWGPNNETHDQVVRIDKLLKERNFRTWLDEVNLKYYVSNDIVDGLKKSSCILVFITELYLEKVENADSNASKEFKQAVKKGTKFLVPVVLDPKCLDPRSWFGSTVGYNFTDALYFDFSSEEKIKANIGKLCERIEEMSTVERT